MRKILLTSSGFETDRIMEVFKSLFDIEPMQIKALFIPTAANFPDAISVLPACMNVNQYINNGGVYVGVSAGSIIAANMCRVYTKRLPR